eukprot:3252994-Prymnesium_polylepis.1
MCGPVSPQRACVLAHLGLLGLEVALDVHDLAVHVTEPLHLGRHPAVRLQRDDHVDHLDLAQLIELCEARRDAGRSVSNCGPR